MTKELLEQRLKTIEQAIEQTMANLNMLLGGKQECLYYISQLENKDVSNANTSLDGS